MSVEEPRAAGEHTHEPHGDIPHGHGSVGRYVAVFAALLALTALTVWVAQFDIGLFNTPLALGIAFCKATLVAIFFMHLDVSPNMSRLVMVAGVAWVGLMITLTVADLLTRVPIPGW